MKHDKILLEHGGGGLLSGELISGHIVPHFQNQFLKLLEDSAVLPMGDHTLCFTTDSYVVSPLFFPGGNIGSLAVHGTVNDLSVSGGTPLYMSCSLILEEGFPLDSLDIIIKSMSGAAKEAGVIIVTGDTKVVARGAADGLFINTAGIGIVDCPNPPAVAAIEPGDVIIVNGTVGDHGAAIMQARKNLSFTPEILSDSAPLNGLIARLMQATPNIHCMRDATRGGLGAILADIASTRKLCFRVDESAVPLRDTVRGACEILGLDPLFLANEGKMVLFCPEADAGAVLDVMTRHRYGEKAAVIGRVSDEGRRGVILKTVIGGERMIDLPTGELVPRIC